jgi:hypothetical protein
LWISAFSATEAAAGPNSYLLRSTSPSVGRERKRERERDGLVKPANLVRKAEQMYPSSADNPVFDARLHQVQFPDRGVEEYSTNIIAECLYSKIDQEGNQYVIILEEIIDYDNEEQEDTTLNSMKG